MVKETLAAADELAAEGIDAEVIDLATLKPYDEETVLASVSRTGRCVIVHEAARTGGFGAEIAALLAERGLTLPAGADRARHRLRYHHAASAARAALHALGRPRRHGGAQSLSVRLNRKTSMRQFNLPDLGEGLEEAEIVTWHVNEGDHVVVDQPLVSVETDKAVVEVPSPWSGRIARLFGGKGDLIKVGAPLVEFAEGTQGDAGTVVGELGQEERLPAAPRPRPRRRRGPFRSFPRSGRSRASSTSISISCKPAGPAATITRADVERAAKSLAEAGPAEPLRGMRRAMAQRMASGPRRGGATTVNDEADIDDWRKGEDVTIRIVRAIAAACQGRALAQCLVQRGGRRAEADQAHRYRHCG